MHQIFSEFQTVVFRCPVLMVVILGPSVFQPLKNNILVLPQRDPFTISYWEELPFPLKMFYSYIHSLGKGYEKF
jgi:hypothetical protein